MLILDLCSRWPGSAHDATIFINSTLCEKFEREEFGKDSIVLGDSAYGPEYYMCKPLRNAVTNTEKKYQRSQIKTRNVAERTFGLLKRRFACLSIGMHYQLNKVQDIIVACCILHNMITQENNATRNDPITNEELDFQAEIGARLRANQGRNQQLHTRNFLIDNYF